MIGYKSTTDDFIVKIELVKDQRLSEFKNDKYDFGKNGLPTGIIDKKYTGLGATFCEINSERNSIIVSPTRALARSKYEESKEKDKTGKNSYFYLGGGYEKITDKDIEDFLKKPGFKKIFVVANSFDKIIKAGGQSVYTDFALVVDEIDSLQQDTSYRSNLEFVIDFFWDFTNKTVVTATYIDFSDSRFKPTKEFPLFEVEIKDYDKTELIYNEVQNPILGTINLIDQLLKEDSDKKIFVALNSITYINSIIKTLLTRSTYNLGDFGVLCSERSAYGIYPNVKKIDLVDGKLEKKINFATSAYFVGVDILEPVHLIVCNSDKKPHTVIFPEKILQIIGRSRVKAHSLNLITFRKLSNPFIKSSFPLVERNEFIERINPFKETLNDFEKNYKNSNQKDKEAIQKKLLTIEIGGVGSLLRRNYFGKLVISDFTIDYLSYNSKRAREYEKGTSFLRNYLKNYFKIKDGDIYTTEFAALENLTSIELVESFLINHKSYLLRASVRYKDPNWYIIQLNEAELNKNRPTTSSLLLQNLYFEYIYGSELADQKIREYNKDKSQIKSFARLFKLFKLSESDFFKNKLTSKFQENEEYTFDEMKLKFLELHTEKKKEGLSHLSDFVPVDVFQNQKLLGEMIESLFEVKKVRKGKKKILHYEILSFESSNFKQQKKVNKKDSNLKIQELLGVDEKSVVLSVPNELLDSFLK